MGNTTRSIEMVFSELRKEGIECEMVMLGSGFTFLFSFFLFHLSHNIFPLFRHLISSNLFILLFSFYFSAPCVHSCVGCGACAKAGHCVHDQDGDPVNLWWKKAQEADGIILASPTHFANVTTETKSFIDRIGLLALNTGKLKAKVGASLVVYRRGGAIAVHEAITKFFTYLNIHCISSTYWYVMSPILLFLIYSTISFFYYRNECLGLVPGDVEKDEEGKVCMSNLGKNMAFMLKTLNDIPAEMPKPTESSDTDKGLEVAAAE